MNTRPSLFARSRHGAPSDHDFSPATLRIGKLVIGEGAPKIIVPITGKSPDEVLHVAHKIARSDAADLAEFRIDYLAESADPTKALAVSTICKLVRNALAGKPLLVTFRTNTEGGERAISEATYEHLYRTIMSAEATDLTDIQMTVETARIRRLVELAHAKNIGVVMSNHDFDGTPPTKTLVARLRYQQTLGADILKLAVMPKQPGDALRLMQATWEMYNLYAERPLLTMSMGGIGVVSRISGQLTGSSLSYGSIGASSAPGQLDAGDLKQVLSTIQKSSQS